VTIPAPRKPPTNGDSFSAVTRRVNATAREADVTRQRISRTTHGDCQLALYWLLAKYPETVARALDWAQASR